MQTEALVIGYGPAGCTAAMYLCRAGRQVLLLGKDTGALRRAETIENYYGLAEPLPGKDLAKLGQQQAVALGATLRKDEVLALDWRDAGDFMVTTAAGQSIIAKTVLLATGRARHAPPIQGLQSFEGRGVSYCAVCDAFLYRGKTVAVLGHSRYAQHELAHLLPLAGSVVLLTNGQEPSFAPPKEVQVHRAKVQEVAGDEVLRKVVLEDGQSLELEGLFVAMGTATASDLARKLGLKLENNAIAVGAEQQTQLPGLFAAGDCTGAFGQIAFAVAAGAKAGLAMAAYLKEE